MSLDVNAGALELGGESGFHEAHEFVGVRYGDGVALAAANDRAGDGVKFGLATGGDVFLHRAAHLARRGLLEGEEGALIDLGSFGWGDRGCFWSAAVVAGGAPTRPACRRRE